MLWDVAWDQQNVIKGKVYSDHIADIMGKSGSEGPGGVPTSPVTTPSAGTGAATTPSGPTPGGSTPSAPIGPATPPSPGGGEGADGMFIHSTKINFVNILNAHLKKYHWLR